jgi:phosphoribosylformimino-5-aminoimidazole carboxamide ribotide isomerase
MKFRPCIDLHNGKVKQIVGSSLCDDNPADLKTNFTTDQPSSYFARMYKQDKLTGGHIIKLGPGNDVAATEALQAFPKGMHIGGGITPQNAPDWLERGASAVIVTSYVFQDGKVHREKLAELVSAVGSQNLVIDLSCRKKEGDYFVVTDRWQKFTNTKISLETLDFFAQFCSEFLIHAADVEGKCSGVASDLVENLGKWVTIPTTYAGGVRSLSDMELVKDLGGGRLDVTVGSSLDIFGGSGIRYQEAVRFHRNCQHR